MSKHLRCPYCKRLAAMQPECFACYATGNVSRDTYDAAPKELKQTGDDESVYVNGKLTKTFMVK